MLVVIMYWGGCDYNRGHVPLLPVSPFSINCNCYLFFIALYWYIFCDANKSTVQFSSVQFLSCLFCSSPYHAVSHVRTGRMSTSLYPRSIWNGAECTNDVDKGKYVLMLTEAKWCHMAPRLYVVALFVTLRVQMF